MLANQQQQHSLSLLSLRASATKSAKQPADHRSTYTTAGWTLTRQASLEPGPVLAVPSSAEAFPPHAARTARASDRTIARPAAAKAGRVCMARFTDGRSLRAAVIDLDFELFPKDKTTYKNLVRILNRYLLVADEERKQHPGQEDMCLVLLGRPAVIEQVQSLTKKHPQGLLVFEMSIQAADGGKVVSLYVLLEVRAEPAVRHRTHRVGTVSEEEMRKDFQRLREPDWV
jgi:hypothetical protein